MSAKRIRLKNSPDQYSAYLELHDHPKKLQHGIVKRTVAIHGLIEDYDGPTLNIDFDEHNRAIGIEILYPYLDE